MDNLANIVTLMRVAVTPLFVVFMVLSNSHPGYRYAAVAVFMFAAFTDWADGQIARRTKTVSKFGVIVDPLADRLFIGATIITLYAMRILPLAFLVLVLGRDVIMAAGYPFIGKIDMTKVAVHWSGKVATATLFAALTCLVLSPAPHSGSRTGFSGYAFTTWNTWQTIGLWLFAVGILWSLYSAGIYIKRAIAALKEEASADNTNGAAA
ncbi:MAG TPA: CDP-alcohol phosphatidyltransferase family protein [Candidatus Anoxymicrobiaceae bacterium]